MSRHIARHRRFDLGSISHKSFWKFTIPIFGFVFFSAIYGTIDMYWISKLNTDAFYAVSVSIPIFTLISSIGDAIGQGTNSLMSRSIGSNDYENAYNTLLHGILICLVIWIIVILSIPILDNLLSFFNFNKCQNLIKMYLIPIFLCSLTLILPNFFSETLQVEGDSKRPAAVLIIGYILNLILDPILIFYFNMGINGAACATILSSLSSTLVLIYLYLSKRTKVSLHPEYFKLDTHILFEILKVGIPNFVVDYIFCITAIFINAVLFEKIGEMGILLYATSCKLETLLISPVKAFGRALMSVTGHLFGSKKIDEIKNMYHYVLKVSLVTIIVISIAFSILRNVIFKAFSIYGIEITLESVAIFGVILITLTVILISAKILDGFGKSYYVLLFTIMNLFIKMALISLLNDMLPNGYSVLVGIAATQTIFAAVYYIFLKKLFGRLERQSREDTLVVI